MARYNEEFKHSIITRMMPPQNQSVADIAKETGLSEATLHPGAEKRERRVLLFQVERLIAAAGVLKINFRLYLNPPH